MIRCISIIFLFFSFCSYGRTVSGTIFEDRNSNGRRDSGEKGISRVAVSDGDTVVLSDRSGRFVLETNNGRIFAIVPSEYYISGAKIGNCNYISLPEGDNDIKEIDIALKKQQVKPWISS